MATAKSSCKNKLPGRFDELVRFMPPQAIGDEIQHENTIEIIDRLMALGKLTKGQSLYLETLVQLVQAGAVTLRTENLRGIRGIRACKSRKLPVGKECENVGKYDIRVARRHS